MERNYHFIVLYVLLAIVALWLLYNQLALQPESGEWQCSNVICAESVGPEGWVQENCFLAAGENSSQVPVCRIVVNGANQLVPLDSLNLTNARQCIRYTCVQEVNVRTTNYTINISTQS
jgi:hypothetical protein